jgi:hypothetical protein
MIRSHVAGWTQKVRQVACFRAGSVQPASSLAFRTSWTPWGLARRKRVITRFLSASCGFSDCGPLGRPRRQTAETRPRPHPPPCCG